MKKAFALIFLLVSIHIAFAQQCDCSTEFEFLKNYLEANHPGLNSNNRKNSNDYKNAVSQIFLNIKIANPKEECILYLQQYISLLKDHHTHINPIVPSSVSIKTQAQIDSFFQTVTYKNDIKRQVDSAYLVNQLKDKKIDEIEGLYKDFNGNLIAFVKEDSKEWPYKGITLTSVRTFTKGTVRYMLQPIDNGKLWAMILLSDYQKVYTTISLKEGKLTDIALSKINVHTNDINKDKSPYEFKPLTDSTNYLRVSSFHSSLYSELDSFYKSIDPQIISKPYLIIDVRNNSGGSEGNYFSLLKYLYTNPIYPDVFQYYSTPDNIKRYKESLSIMKADSNHYGSGMIKTYEEVIKKMEKSKPYSFLQTAQQMPITLKSYSTYPKKVIILTNQGCASSCEAFIYNTSQSKKVETIGENTGGFVGYGNILPFKTPCFGYTFESTTTKYAHLYQYEFVGIPPKIKLSNSVDWIQTAINRLEK